MCKGRGLMITGKMNQNVRGKIDQRQVIKGRLAK